MIWLFMILKLHLVSAMQFSVEFSECSFLCLKIVPFRTGDAAFVLAVQALRTCSLTSSTGNSSTASCIIPREGYLKTVAFLAVPRKFTLLLLVPVSKSGDLSSEDEESETEAAPDVPGKFDEEEALLAPSFLFFLAALDLAFFFFFSAALDAFNFSSCSFSMSFLKRQNSALCPLQLHHLQMPLQSWVLWVAFWQSEHHFSPEAGRFPPEAPASLAVSFDPLYQEEDSNDRI